MARKKKAFTGQGNVGLFWYDPKTAQVWDERKLPVDSAPETFRGVKDHPALHANVWQEHQRKVPQHKPFDYDEVPRGRVLMKNDRFKVYLDPEHTTNTKVKNALMKAYDLPSNRTDFTTDEHYQTATPMSMDTSFQDMFDDDNV